MIVVEPHARDLGGFTVGRVLPALAMRHVGPFVFFDHMGPAELPPGHGIDVRPHPHVNLATVTYLFEGAIVHKDSLGSDQAIHPGDINWMTAGRGIVHSERTGADLRRAGSRLHGIQLWVALPTADEEAEPAFHHHPAGTLPVVDAGGARTRVLAGALHGVRSPVRVFSPLAYADAVLPGGAELVVPDEYEERAAYVVEGTVSCGAEDVVAPRLLVFEDGEDAVLRSAAGARVLLLCGAPLDGPRHLYWNFVSSSKERIERAKSDWREGRFPKVPGDEEEFIPLPDG